MKKVKWLYIAVICGLLCFSASGCWEVLTAKIASGDITVESVLEQGEEIVEIGKKGIETDWSDPTQVSAFAALVISLGMNFLQDKKGKKKDKQITGLNAGISKFEGTHDVQVAGELHDIVKHEMLKA